MIVLALTQHLLAQSYLGGSAQDLAILYGSISHRSVVCSERILNGYGPQRFRISESNEISAEGTFFKILHNSPKQAPKPPPGLPAVKTSSQVDSIECSIYPLDIVGLVGVNGARTLREKATNPSDLQFQTPSLAQFVSGQGSDSVENLINRGFSKQIIYPSLFGKLWYSCALNFCSEFDLLTAIGQIIDCSLVSTKDKYEFIPNAEKIRTRFLTTYEMFGTDSGDYFTLKQRVRYEAYQQATPEQIIESVTNRKMYLILKLKKGSQLAKDCAALKDAAIAKFRDDENPTANGIIAKVKEGGEISLVMGYAFSASPLIELKDGTSWGIG